MNWQHIWMSALERDLRTAFTWPLTLAVVLFPITLVTSAASRLEYVFCPHSSGGTGAVSCSRLQRRAALHTVDATHVPRVLELGTLSLCVLIHSCALTH